MFTLIAHMFTWVADAALRGFIIGSLLALPLAPLLPAHLFHGKDSR